LKLANSELDRFGGKADALVGFEDFEDAVALRG